MQLCIFDLDGTLINSIKDIAFAMNEALVTCGYEPYNTEDYYRMVGNGMRILCARAVQNNPVKDGGGTEKVEAEYAKLYIKNCSKYTEIYPGVLSCLLKLKEDGFSLGIISNKPQAQVRKVIDALFPKDLFLFVQGQTEGIKIKPHPMSMLMKLDEYGFKAEEAAFVGDSDADIEFGKNSGVDTIGVLWGFRGKDELVGAGADFVAENPKELYQILKNRSAEKIKKI